MMVMDKRVTRTNQHPSTTRCGKNAVLDHALERRDVAAESWWRWGGEQDEEAAREEEVEEKLLMGWQCKAFSSRDGEGEN